MCRIVVTPVISILTLLSALTALSVADAEDLVCGVDSVTTVRITCEGTFHYRFIFFSFPDAIAAGGDSLLPSYTNDMVTGFKAFMDTLSLGAHTVEGAVVKREGPDSVYAWMLPNSSTTYTNWSTLRSTLHAMFPTGWDDLLDCPVYTALLRPACFSGSVGGCNYGHICTPHPVNYVYIKGGSIVAGNYQARPQHEVQGTLVHEVGHQLGANHLPDQTNKWGDRCSGGYMACYCAMDRWLMMGCSHYTHGHNGWVSYHPFNLIRFGWLEPTVIETSTTDILLRDVRLAGQVLKVPTTYQNEYFLVLNHQRTLYDEALNGRGLLIWHIRERTGTYSCGPGSDLENHIIDLEHQSGEFDPDGEEPLCPGWPHVANAATGTDTLDCTWDMLPSAFYGGLAAGGVFTPNEFGKETNPCSNQYVESADDRRDAQTDSSGVTLERIRAVGDPNAQGKYMMKFDVIVNR